MLGELKTLLGNIAIMGIGLLVTVAILWAFCTLSGNSMIVDCEPFAYTTLISTTWFAQNGSLASVNYNHTVDRACEGHIYVYDIKDKNGQPHVAIVDFDIGADCLPTTTNGISSYGSHDWRSVSIDGISVYEYHTNTPPPNMLTYIPLVGLPALLAIILSLFHSRSQEDEEKNDK